MQTAMNRLLTSVNSILVIVRCRSSSLLILWSMIGLFSIAMFDMSTFALALTIEDNNYPIKETERWEDIITIDRYGSAIDNSYQTQATIFENVFFQFNNDLMLSKFVLLKSDAFPLLSNDDIFSNSVWGDLSQIEMLTILRDKYGPEQIILTPFIFRIKITIYGLIGVTLFSLIGIVVLDYRTFRIILRNCIRSDRSISFKRTRIELYRLFKYSFTILINVILYILVHGALLYPLDKFILPIHTIVKIFSVFDADPKVWEDNIKLGIYGDINTEHEIWLMKKGFSLAGAEFIQFILCYLQLLRYQFILFMVLIRHVKPL